MGERRLDVLDGLRGTAIALVLWFHVWQQSWQVADLHVFGRTWRFNFVAETGFVGVELFFFISGFCLFYPYARTIFDGHRLQTAGEFALRRVMKIMPSYLLAIAAFSAIGYANFSSAHDAVRQIALHLLFIHPWYADSFGSINGALWSLGVEVQFYVLFPLLVLLWRRSVLVSATAMIGSAIVYRVFVAHYHADEIVRLVNQLPAVLDLFAAGMLTAYAYRAIAVRAPVWAQRRILWTALAVAALVGGVGLLTDLYQARVLPDWYANWFIWKRTALAVDFFALTLGSLFALPAWRALLANPVLAFLSIVSYNLYLWHPVVAFYLKRWQIPPWHGTQPQFDSTWQLPYTVLAMFVSIVVAAAITYPFERPLLRWRPKKNGGSRSVRSPV